MDNFFNTIRNSIEVAKISLASEDKRIVYIILGTAPDNIEEIVVMPAVDAVYNTIKKTLRNTVKQGLIINGSLGKHKISLVKSGVGAPATAMVLEALRRTKCKVIFRLDFCGALSKTGSEEHKNACRSNIKIADVVISDSIYHTDGTSLGYAEKYLRIINEYLNLGYGSSETASDRLDRTPIHSNTALDRSDSASDLFNFVNTQSINTRIYPNFKNKYIKSSIRAPQQLSPQNQNKDLINYIKKTDALRQSCLTKLNENKVLSKAQADCTENEMILWSEDALFCEDVRSIATWRFYNAKLVDMETSIIMLFSKLFKIPAIPILVVSDIVDSAGNEWFAPRPEKIRLLQNIKSIVKTIPQILDHFVSSNQSIEVKNG